MEYMKQQASSMEDIPDETYTKTKTDYHLPKVTP